MPVIRQIIYLFYLLGVAGALQFGYAESSAPIHTLTLKTGQNSYELGPFIEILEDETGEWTIDKVTAEPLLNKFVPAKSRNINLGLSESAFWFRLSIRTEVESKKDNRWFIKIDRCGLTDCKLFVAEHAVDQLRNPSEWQTPNSYLTPINDRQKSIVCRPTVLPLPPLTTEPTTFYLRIYNPDGGLYLPIRIVTADALDDSITNKTIPQSRSGWVSGMPNSNRRWPGRICPGI